MTSPPSLPSALADDLDDGHVAVGQPDDAAVRPRSGSRARSRLVAAMVRTWAWMSRQARHDGVAHEDRGAARRGLLVVGHDGGVAHDDVTLSIGRAQLVGRDLGEDRARALAHVAGAGEDQHAAVGEQAHRRVGEAGGGAGLDAHGQAAPPTRAAAACPSR